MRARLMLAASAMLAGISMFGSVASAQTVQFFTVLAGGNDLMNIANGARPAAPQNGEDFQFRIGRSAWFLRHIRRLYYDTFRMSRAS